MRKLFLSTILIVLVMTTAFSQTKDDFKRYDIFTGYSHLLLGPVKIPIIEATQDGSAVTYKDAKDSIIGIKGVNVSATGNLNRYFGLKFDFSRHAQTRRVPNEVTPSVVRDVPLQRSLYNFLGGIQFKDNSKTAKIKPFFHLLGGKALSREEGTLRSYEPDQTQFFNTMIVRYSSFKFSGAVGGGIDVKINDKLDLRAVQLEYNQSAYDGQVKALRIGAGIVFR